MPGRYNSGFSHRQIATDESRASWEKLRKTVSREAAFQATVVLGRALASDMLGFADRDPKEIDRIHVKLRDGMPMAAGMKRAIPNADIRYIISKEKQGHSTSVPIGFWDDYDGHANSTVWYADPINATGHTAIETLAYVRRHFKFDTVLLSHVAANIAGIRTVQTSLSDFDTEGYMNYVHLSTALDPRTGYMKDGLELIPDFGDKVWGTLGEDYAIYEIQDQLRSLQGTEAWQVELVKGTILHLIQMGGGSEYVQDRNISWITKSWITAALDWYHAMEGPPFRPVNKEQVDALVDDLLHRDFLRIERRPWRQTYANVYSLTEDGVNYASSVYIPILAEAKIASRLQENFDFLIRLRPEQILQTITDAVLA